MPVWLRCGSPAARWTGLLVLMLAACSASGVAQQVPAASTPARTNSAVQSGAASATPAQTQQSGKPAATEDEVTAAQVGPGLAMTVWDWKGLRVEKIVFEGVTFDATDTLPKELAQKAGEPLDPAKVRASVRRLFASGRYRDIEVRGVRQGDAVTLIFAGPPRYYVGRVTIAGVKSDRLTSLLEFATKLSPGTAFSEPQLEAGSEGITQMLQQQGYYQPKVMVQPETDVAGDQVNVTYTVAVGPQARVGQVQVEGTDAGLTPAEFRKKGKLKQGSKVTRDTASNALDRLRKLYQKRDRLEATVTLEKQTYVESRKQVDYEFKVHEGPEVKVSVEGAKISKSRLRLLVPIYEEGTIDNDLLNEGVFNIRDFEQQQGYFDAKVAVRVVGQGAVAESVVFTVDQGVKA